MLDFSLLFDALLVVLLLVTLIYVYRFNRRLAQLREGRLDFERLVADFAKATDKASKSIVELKLAADTAGQTLQQRLESAGRAASDLRGIEDDMRMLESRAEACASQLESLIARGRNVGAPYNAPMSVSIDEPVRSETGRSEGPRPGADIDDIELAISSVRGDAGQPAPRGKRLPAGTLGMKEKAGQEQISKVLSGLGGIR